MKYSSLWKLLRPTRRQPLRRLRIASLGAGISAAFFALTTMPAQEAEPAATVELDPFAVEAFRLPFSVELFPGSTDVLLESEIRATGAQNLAELLEASGNLILHSSSGNLANAQLDMRGHGESGGLRSLVLVDGLPLNRADMGSFSWLEVPLGRVERVEILRGPQSARFGNHAVGGVINIVTRLEPGDQPELQFEAGFGSWSSNWQRLHHSRPLAGGALAVAVERSDSDGYRSNSGYESLSGSANYAYSWEGGPTLRAGISWLEDELEFPGSLPSGTDGGFPDDPRASAYGELDPLYFSDNRKASANAALSWPLHDDSLRLELRGNATRRELDWNFGPGFHSDLEQTTARLVPEIRAELEGGHSWGIGISLEETELTIDRFAELERINALAEAELETSILAAFANAEIQLAENLTGFVAFRLEENRVEGIASEFAAPEDPGLNFDHRRSLTHSAWQIGLQWQPLAGQRAWIRYDRLYRFPVTDEIAYYQGFPTVEPFNADLDAERGHNLELGWELSRQQWSAELNLFAQTMEGEIGYDYLRNHNTNLADTQRFGAELSLSARLAGWQGQLAYTWINAEFRDGPNDGRDIPLVSPHALSLRLLSPEWARSRLSSELIYRHRSHEGSDFSNTQPSLPGWTVLNLQLRTELSSSTTAFFRVNNLFDREYATLKFFGFWYPAAGRHARAGLEFRF